MRREGREPLPDHAGVMGSSGSLSCGAREVRFLCASLGGVWDLSSPTRDQTLVPCIANQILNHWATRKVPNGLFSEAVTQNMKDSRGYVSGYLEARSGYSGFPPKCCLWKFIVPNQAPQTVTWKDIPGRENGQGWSCGRKESQPSLGRPFWAVVPLWVATAPGSLRYTVAFTSCLFHTW